MGEHHGHRFDQIDRLRSAERLERLEVNRVTELSLQGITARSMIDIGTGSGIFAEAFANHGLAVTGIDANPEMLAAAAPFAPNGEFREAVAESIPYPDMSFDLAFMGLVLHETDDPLKALQEAFRVSQNRLAILEWPYAEQDYGPGLEERLRPEQIEALARQAGFQQFKVSLLKTLVLYRLDKGGQNGEGSGHLAH